MGVHDSARGCGMFQEPFFLHPPGSRPRDGIYINPMTAYIGEPAKPAKDAESFYLHSPQDLVYTRITRLFTEAEKGRPTDKRDEPVTVKVDVHVDNGFLERGPSRSEGGTREPSEHAYEQICPRQPDPEAGAPRKPSDAPPDRSRSRKAERRCSGSSSASDSSNLSSEIPACFSSTGSTPPSVSRTSSTERIGRNGKLAEPCQEKKDATAESPRVESEKGIEPGPGGASSAKPPPPPPPPPPPDREDVSRRNSSTGVGKDERRERGESADREASTATNESEASCRGEHREQPEAPAASPAADPAEEIKPNQTSHLVNKHMVLPFIPPQFANADSNTLLKPSEYLRSICEASAKNSLSKARSVDNLDIQSGTARRRRESRGNPEQPAETAEAEEEVDPEEGDEGERREAGAPPPPPPLSPLRKPAEPETARSPQPLATISIQDLSSIQLRRTTAKMSAAKTFSAPPPRSVSMTNVSESFFVQKTDLIAELKRTKDIPGIKKLKVEMARVEKTQERNLMSEISKAFSASNFVDQIPERDSSGNAIPIWKRQMLARKAAERAKKELEERIARENEERRQKAIPAWKRQLLAKKEPEEKRPTVAAKTPDAAPPPKREASPSPSRSRTGDEKPELVVEERKPEPGPAGQPNRAEEPEQIIPWRAQLRKTNSKLNILD